MLRYLMIAAFLMPVSAAFAGPECTCRYMGQDIKEGHTICMKTPKGMQLATCGRVLNNTAWKFLGESCVYSSLDMTPEQQRKAASTPALPSEIREQMLSSGFSG